MNNDVEYGPRRLVRRVFREARVCVSAHITNIFKNFTFLHLVRLLGTVVEPDW